METPLTDRKGIRFDHQPDHLDLLEISGLLDLFTTTPSLIDGHVAADVDHTRWHDAFGPDLVAYSVVDGERSGVWLARPR